MEQIYLDWAATALPDKEIIQTAVDMALETFGNPSSPHRSGKEAAALLSAERKITAAALGTVPERLFFTSGGTESNNIVISSLLNKKRPGNIVISGIEHSSVYEPAKMLEKFGWEVRIVNPEPDGRLSVEDFTGHIDEDTRMAAVIMVNNETGAVQPVEEIGRLIKTTKACRLTHFHVDAVQAAGKYHLDLDKLPIDSASFSSHKFRGPRGCGLLYLKKHIDPVYDGGGQENGMRHGTENTFGITATASALYEAAANIEDNQNHALKLKRILLERLSEIMGIRFNSGNAAELLDPSLYSPYILSVSVKPVPGEILVRVMSDKGFDIATGSACATGKKKKSRVMESMGINQEEAFSTVRISTGVTTSIEEIHQFCDTFVRESTILIDSLSR